MRKLALLCAAVLAAAIATPAWAHVTVQPTEALAGSFSRFVVRVPNERDDAGTVRVEVQFPPNVTNASFQPKQGWTRSVTTRTLDEPIEVFGEPVTEVIDTVVWEGGRIAPGEFDEFGFSIRTPDDPGELLFPAVQTYDSGEEVRWVGEAGSESPAGRVTVTPAEGESHGAGPEAGSEDASDDGSPEQEGDAVTGDEAEPEAAASTTLPTLLGAAGTVLGAIALAVALGRR